MSRCKCTGEAGLWLILGFVRMAHRCYWKLRRMAKGRVVDNKLIPGVIVGAMATMTVESVGVLVMTDSIRWMLSPVEMAHWQVERARVDVTNSRMTRVFVFSPHEYMSPINNSYSDELNTYYMPYLKIEFLYVLATARHPSMQGRRPSKGQSRPATQIPRRRPSTPHHLRRQRNPLTSCRLSRSEPPSMRKGRWNRPGARDRSARRGIRARRRHGHLRGTSPLKKRAGTLPTSSTCALKTPSHWSKILSFRRLGGLSSTRAHARVPIRGPARVLSPPIRMPIQGRQYCSRGSKN